MDYYRESYIKTEMLAKKISSQFKNNYLSDVSQVLLNSSAYDPDVKTWYRLKGYRMKESMEETKQASVSAVKKWMQGARTIGATSVFLLLERQKELYLWYGAGKSNPADSAFSSELPEINGQYTEEPNLTEYPYQGVILGSIFCSPISDILLTSSLNTSDDFFVSCVNVPVTDHEITEKVNNNRSMIKYLDNYSKISRNYGNNNRRTEELPIQSVIHAISNLKEENEYYIHNMSDGFVKNAIRFGARDAETYLQLKAILMSSLNRSEEDYKGFEPVRSFDIQNSPLWNGSCFAIPGIKGTGHLLSIQPTHIIAPFCLPPVVSHKGFHAKNYNVSENSLQAFPLPDTDDNCPGIEIGKSVEDDSKVRIPLRSLLSHTFITGGTDTGKTSLEKLILKRLYDNKINFFVLEAAKKEYISLLGDIPDLRILTPGNDGLALNINPLQPEEGTLIEKHVDAVVRAVVSSNGGEHPIPEALEGLFKLTYEKFGWEYGDIAYNHKTRKWPKLDDALKNIPLYINEHGDYGPEVKKNLQAALKIRIEHLTSSKILNRSFGLTAKDLLEFPTVVELSDFSQGMTIFLMNIILFKIHSYLSRLPEARTLKRVIVVEEAHNVFRRVNDELSGQYLINSQFEKMLSEIRACGTGMLLIDQQPTKMCDGLMANTSVKIAFALSGYDDRELVGKSMGLSQLQIAKLYELGIGECVLGLRGVHGVQKVNVSLLKTEGHTNPACHVCPCRFSCRREEAISMLEGSDQIKLLLHLERIQSNPYDIRYLNTSIDAMTRDLDITGSDSLRLCFLGEALEKYGNLSYQDKRVIINSYHKLLKGGANHE